MTLSLLMQIAQSTGDPIVLGSNASGWITNGIVVALVLFIRHLYEDRLKAEREWREDVKKDLEKLDARDQLRSDTLDRTLRAIEQQGELNKSQNAMVQDMYEKNAELMANMQGRLDASEHRGRESTR